MGNFLSWKYQFIKEKCISIVGSRIASEYGITCTKKIVKQLSNEYVIVSGLAKGIDAISHEAAINENKHTIGVIGSGLLTHYPRCNEDLYQEMFRHELVISEYPDQVGVRKEHFPWRNRLIAALGEKLIVTEASYKSGTMLTVNEAICLSKEIYVVPYPLSDTESGCNLLANQGANVIYDWKQVKYL